jgi:hypothetical protein
MNVFLPNIIFISELLGENASGPGAALGFQYYGGQIVTVLASKTSRK